MRSRIYKRPTGWYIDYTGRDGQRVRTKAGTKADAQNILAAVRSSYLRGEYGIGPAASIRLREFKDEYLEYVRSKQRVVRRHEQSLKNLLPALGEKYLNKINLDDIIRYKNERLKSVKGATVNRELACLRHLLNVAKKKGLIHGPNPVTREDTFSPEPKKIPHILSNDEIKKLLDAVDPKAPHLRLAIIVALATGLRKSEVLCLRWANVDFENRRIILEKTKAGRPYVVSMSGLLFDELKKAKAGADGEYVFRGWRRADKKTDYIEDEEKAMADVKRAFNTAKKKAGLDDVTFHSLRHCAAVFLDQAGVSAAVISRQLGHSSITMTEGYLRGLMKEDMIKAAEKLGAKVEAAIGPEKKGTGGALEQIDGSQVFPSAGNKIPA